MVVYFQEQALFAAIRVPYIIGKAVYSIRIFKFEYFNEYNKG